MTRLSDELVRRACMRIDRRAGPGMRRGGRNSGGGGSLDEADVALYAAENFSAANYFATQVGGGEIGIASGFGSQLLLYLAALPTTSQIIAHCVVAPGANQGWYWQIAGGLLRLYCINGAAANVGTPAYTFVPSDVGKVLLFTGQHTGTGMRLTVGRDKWSNDTPITGYTPAAATAHQIGQWNGSQLFTSGAVLAHRAFRGTPSAANLAADADAARSLGDLPEAMSGATVTHHWSLKKALAGAYAVTGQAAPAALADNITGLAADVQTKVGSPTVRRIDPSVDGRKTYGVQGSGVAGNYLKSATLLPGSAAGFAGSVVATFWGHSSHVIGRSAYGASGWILYVSSGSSMVLAVYNGSGFVQTSAFAITSGIYGIPHLVTFQHTGSALRLFVNGVQIGSDVAIAGFVPYVGDTTLLASVAATLGPTLSLSALTVHLPTITPAEVAAQHVAWKATGVLPEIPGKTPNRFEFTDDIIANGGPDNGVPAIVLDRIGSDHLARVGAGLTVAQRVERTYAWETTPVVSGVKDFSAANHYVNTGGFPGSFALGHYVSLLITINAQTSSANRIIWERSNQSTEGQSFVTAGLNSTITYTCWDGSANKTSPSYAILAGDVGKLLLVTGVLDPTGFVRLVVKRAQVAVGTGITAYVPGTAPQYIGIRNGSTLPASDITVWGYSAGYGSYVLAEHQALHDAVMGAEDIRGIPGKTTVVQSFKADVLANGGTLPAVLSDGSTRVGAPTLVNQYGRPWAW